MIIAVIGRGEDPQLLEHSGHFDQTGDKPGDEAALDLGFQQS